MALRCSVHNPIRIMALRGAVINNLKGRSMCGVRLLSTNTSADKQPANPEAKSAGDIPQQPLRLEKLCTLCKVGCLNYSSDQNRD